MAKKDKTAVGCNTYHPGLIGRPTATPETRQPSRALRESNRPLGKRWATHILLPVLVCFLTSCGESSRERATATNAQPVSLAPVQPPRAGWKAYQDITRLFTIHYPADWIVRQQPQSGGFRVTFTPIQDTTIAIEDLHVAASVVVEFTPAGNPDAYLRPEVVFARQRPIYEAINRKYEIAFEGQDTVRLPGVPDPALVRGRFRAQSRGHAFQEDFIRIPKPRWVISLVCDYTRGDARLRKQMEAIQQSLVLPAGPCEPAAVPPALKAAQEDPVKKLRECTVLVVVKDAKGNPEASGTGFLIHPAGYILSNAHVVQSKETKNGQNGEAKGDQEPKRKYEVRWDQRVGRPSMPADYVAQVSDDRHGLDFALLHIDGANWPFLEPAPAAGQDNVSEIVAAGFPKPDVQQDKLDITIQKGVINRINHNGEGEVQSFFTDLHFDHGNSGGPCIDLRTGRVFGVNSFVTHGDLTAYGGVLPIEKAFEHFAPLYYPAAGSRDVTVDDRFKLANLFWGLNQPLAAIGEIEKASVLDNSNPHLWEMWGMTCELAGQADQAAAFYEKALRNDPKATSALARLIAVGLARSSVDYPKVSQWVDRLIQAEPDLPEGYLLRARLLSRNAQAESALKFIQKAVELGHDLSPEPYVELAKTRRERNGAGDLDEARKAVEKALSIDPLNSEALYLASDLHADRPAVNLDRFAGLATRYPDDPTVHWLLARALAAKETDSELAIRQYESVLKLFLKRDWSIPNEFFTEAGHFGLRHDPPLALLVYTTIYQTASDDDVKQNVLALVGMSQAFLRMEDREDLAAGLYLVAEGLDETWARNCRNQMPGSRSYDLTKKLSDQSAALALRLCGFRLGLEMLARMDWAFEAESAVALRAWLADAQLPADAFFQAAKALQLVYQASLLKPVCFGRPYGYVAVLGGVARLMIEPQFAYAGSFADGLAPVKGADKWGFIDRSGKFVIEPRFDDAGSFSDGLAQVKQAGKWGFIDRTGKFVIEPRFDDAEKFSDGLACVMQFGKFGFIDRSGKFVVEARFDYVGSTREGLTHVNVGGATNRGYSAKPVFGLNYFAGAKLGFVNRHEKYLIEPRFDETQDFNDGLAWVKQGGKCGFIDRSGKFVVEPRFDDAEELSDGLALVKQGGKWGFIDRSGKFMVEPRFDDARPFSDGLAWVKQGGKYGFIDRSGKVVIELDDLRGFSDGLAGVEQGGKWGFIDRSGRLLIEPRFDQVKDFDYGVTAVREGAKWGFIDKSGQYVFDAKFDEVERLGYGVLQARRDGKLYCINRKGEILFLWPPEQ